MTLSAILDAAATHRRAMRHAPPTGPTGVTLLVLLAIVERPGSSPSQLARRCAVDPNDVARALRRLRDDGLIEARHTGPGIRGGETPTTAGQERVAEYLDDLSSADEP